MTTPAVRIVDAGQDPQRLGQLLADSGYFSDAKGAAQAAVKVMAGQELGFPPVQSMMGVYIVKGKVTLSANLMAAAIKRHPNYTFRVKEHTTDRCVIDFIENGEVIGTSDFSIEDAKNAGLTGNDTWRKFPKNMLYARALSNGAKWYCPDVFGGPIYTPDELGAVVDGETGELLSGADDRPVVKAIPAGASDVTEALPWESPTLEQAVNSGTVPSEPADDGQWPADWLLQEIRRQRMTVPEFRAFMGEQDLPTPDDLRSVESRLSWLRSLDDEARARIAHALVERAKVEAAA
jgi:hypothetical protein